MSETSPVTPATVCIATLSPGTCSTEYVRGLVNLITKDQTTTQHVRSYIPKYASGLLGVHRNACVDVFLQGDLEWLFFVDADTVLAPDTLNRLLEAADPVSRPVVSGVYVMLLSGGPALSVFELKYEQHKILDKQILTMQPVPNLPEDQLVECDGVGAGCLLIHRSLLEAMRKVYPVAVPWFAEEVFDDVIYGEDFTFCMRVKQMGFPIYAHTGIGVGHVKQQTLEPTIIHQLSDMEK